eukprot:scaffold16974_cov55-Phaeocystis_antarctica.AAC.2
MWHRNRSPNPDPNPNPNPSVAPLPQLEAVGLGRVAVEGGREQHRAGRFGECAQLAKLVLCEGLGGEEQQHARCGLSDHGLDSGHHVGEALAAGRACCHDHVLPRPLGLQRRRLVAEERGHTARAQRRLERRRQQGGGERHRARLARRLRSGKVPTLTASPGDHSLPATTRATVAGGADTVTAAARALLGQPPALEPALGPAPALGPPPAASHAPARLGGGGAGDEAPGADSRRRLAFFAAAAAACSARLGSAAPAGPLGSPRFAAAAPFLSAVVSLRCTAGGVRALSSASGICAAQAQHGSAGALAGSVGCAGSAGGCGLCGQCWWQCGLCGQCGLVTVWAGG